MSAIYDMQFNLASGAEQTMQDYRDKVLLIVNTASKCGFTPQFEGLEKLNQQFAEKGLVVLGFPCNQFGGQEPGDAGQIQKFCSANYGVKFPMFAKIDVNGDDQSPLYDFLKTTAKDHSNIGWNFEKFIVGKDGKVAARFKTRTKPDAPEIVQVLEEELGK